MSTCGDLKSRIACIPVRQGKRRYLQVLREVCHSPQRSESHLTSPCIRVPGHTHTHHLRTCAHFPSLFSGTNTHAPRRARRHRSTFHSTTDRSKQAKRFSRFSRIESPSLVWDKRPFLHPPTPGATPSPARERCLLTNNPSSAARGKGSSSQPFAPIRRLAVSLVHVVNTHTHTLSEPPPPFS
jgi:hypothetical protein